MRMVVDCVKYTCMQAIVEYPLIYLHGNIGVNEKETSLTIQ